MITAYLSFNGNSEEAFSFYRSVLGGEFSSLHRFGDTPFGENLPDADKRKIMHITLESSHGIIRGNDHLDTMGPRIPGNTISLSIHPRSEDAAKKLFEGLSSGGTIAVPLDAAFWGALFGLFTDKFGIQWMVNYEYPKG